MKGHLFLTVIISVIVIFSVSFYFASSESSSESFTISTAQDIPQSKIQPIPTTGLDPGYYIILNPDGTPSTNEAPIPYGYKLNANGQPVQMTNAELTSYVANNGAPATGTGGTSYNTNNYDVQYHDISPIDYSSTGTWVKDPVTGKVIYVPWSETKGNITYYQPGTYPYGASTYVPSYEDSIYLSKTTGESSVTQVRDTAEIAGGFCANFMNDPVSLEQKCNAIDKNTCASTGCCALLGGAKCVAGNAEGPTYKSNYGDPTILNKDFYYFQGKCYGNCAGSDMTYVDLPPVVIPDTILPAPIPVNPNFIVIPPSFMENINALLQSIQQVT
jgi:hypothetical protein